MREWQHFHRGSKSEKLTIVEITRRQTCWWILGARTYLQLNLFYGHIKGFLTSFSNKAPCFFLSKAQHCETAGCNIKAWSIPLTYKISLTTNKQAERMGSVWLRGEGGREEARGERREKKVELCRRSFVRLFSSLAVRPQNIKVEERNLHSLNRFFLSFSRSSHADCHARALTHACSYIAHEVFHPKHVAKANVEGNYRP